MIDPFHTAFGALVGPPVHGALLTEEYIWWRAALVSGVSSDFTTFSTTGSLVTC